MEIANQQRDLNKTVPQVNGKPLSGNSCADVGNGVEVHSGREAKQPAAPPLVGIRRGGGPHTKVGKENSKYNASKYGVFSQPILLKGESKSEYESLLRGIRRDWMPEGMLEELYVKRIAGGWWGLGRVRIAEAAEIRLRTELPGFDEQLERDKEAPRNLSYVTAPGGLLSQITYPEILRRCLYILKPLDTYTKANCLSERTYRTVLRALYGENGPGTLTQVAFDQYLATLGSDRSHANSERSTPFSDEEAKDHCVQFIKEEKARLERFEKEQVLRMELEALRGYVPDSLYFERLEQREVFLMRAIERDITQLLRLQRARKGQPLPPTLDVNVAT